MSHLGEEGRVGWGKLPAVGVRNPGSAAYDLHDQQVPLRLRPWVFFAMKLVGWARPG